MSQRAKVKIEQESPDTDEEEFESEPEEHVVRLRVVTCNNNKATSDPEDFPTGASSDEDENEKSGKKRKTKLTSSRRRRKSREVSKSKSGSRSTSKKTSKVDVDDGPELKKYARKPKKRVSEMTPEELAKTKEKWRRENLRRKLRGQGLPPEEIEQIVKSTPPPPPKPNTLTRGYTRIGPPGEKRKKRVSEMTQEEQQKIRELWKEQRERRRLRLLAEGIKYPPEKSSAPEEQEKKKKRKVSEVDVEVKKPAGKPKKRVSELTPEELAKTKEKWRRDNLRRKLRGQGLPPEEIEQIVKSTPPPPPKPITLPRGHTRIGPLGQRRKKRLSEMTPEEQEKIREQWRQQKERLHLKQLTEGVNPPEKSLTLTPEGMERRRQSMKRKSERQRIREREKRAKMTPEERTEMNQRRKLRELEKIVNMTDEEKEIYDFKKLCRLEAMKMRRLKKKENPVEQKRRNEYAKQYYHNKVKTDPERRRRRAEWRKISNRNYLKRKTQKEGRVYIPRFKSDQNQSQIILRSTKPKAEILKMTPKERYEWKKKLNREWRVERNKLIMEHVASGMTVEEAYAQFETPEKRQQRLLKARVSGAKRNARIRLRESGASQEVIDRKMEEIEESYRLKPLKKFHPLKLWPLISKTRINPETELQQLKTDDHDDDEVQLETRSAASSTSMTFETTYGHQEYQDNDGDDHDHEIYSQNQNQAAVHNFIVPATGASADPNCNFGHTQRPESEDDHYQDDDDDNGFSGDDDDFQNSPCQSPSPDSPNSPKFSGATPNSITRTFASSTPPLPHPKNQNQPNVNRGPSWSQGEDGGPSECGNPPPPPQPKRGRGRPRKGEVVISQKQLLLMKDPELRAANRRKFERTGARLVPGETFESAKLVVCDLCGLMYRRKKFLRHRVHHHNPHLKPGRICLLCNKKITVKKQHEMFKHFRFEHPAEFEEIRAPVANILGELRVPAGAASKKSDTKPTPKKKRVVQNVCDSMADHLCPECGKGFVTAQKLNDHVYQQHVSKKDRHVCHLCPEHRRKPLLKKSYHEHLRRLHPEADPTIGRRTKVCGPCGQVFLKREELLAHLEENHPGKSHPCRFCPKVFFSRAGAIFHLLRCHGNPTKAQRHEIEQEAENEDEETRPLILRKVTVPCEFCGRTSNLKGLTLHYLASHDIVEDKCFKCWRCEKTHNVRDNLAVHLYDFHGVEWNDEFQERIRKVNMSQEKRANLVVKNPEGKFRGCGLNTLDKILNREKRLKMLGMEVTEENLKRMKLPLLPRRGGSGSRSNSRSKATKSRRKSRKSALSESESEENQEDDTSESEGESWKSSESGSEVEFKDDADKDCGDRRRSARIVKKKTVSKKRVRKSSAGLRGNVGLKLNVEKENYNIEIKKRLIVKITKLSAVEIATYTKKSDASGQ